MSEPTQTTNLSIYGSPPLEWSRARDALEDSAGPESAFLLGAVRPDARPRSAGIGALWVDGALHIVSGPATRKPARRRGICTGWTAARCSPSPAPSRAAPRAGASDRGRPAVPLVS